MYYLIDLSKKINAAQLNPNMLIGKYIPSLVAKPFKVFRDYTQLIYDQTSSPRLDKVLKKWDQDNWAASEQRQKLAYIILVELLAYQFASPVWWIETQDLLFRNYEFELLIELGPSPTLTGMASRTLKAKYEAQNDSVTHPCTILCHAKNGKEIYYQFEDQAVVAEAERTSEPSPPAPPTPAPIASAPAAPTSSSGPVVSVEDAPIKAKTWRAVTLSLMISISRKFRRVFSNFGLSSNRSPELAKNRRTASRVSMRRLSVLSGKLSNLLAHASAHD